MAIYQPSNIIPSTFAGVGLGTVDVNDNVNLSWQVNGNSPLTAYQIKIYDNNQTTPTIVYLGDFTTVNPAFYGVDNKGNPKQFTPSIGGTWADLGLTNGNEYKIEITQWWGSNPTAESTMQITQWSGSVFYTRTTPTLTLQYNGNNYDGSTPISTASATFTADYNQAQGDSINAVRWEVFDSNNNVLDDTGFINTAELSYTYNNLFTGKSYAIRCTVETQNGVPATTDIVQFAVEYSEAVSSGELSVECMADDSVLVSWGEAVNIPGTLTPEGTPNIENGTLNLGSGQSATWNSVNGSQMNFSAPWNLGVKNSINVSRNSYTSKSTINSNITLHATSTITQENTTIHGVANTIERLDTIAASYFPSIPTNVGFANNYFMAQNGNIVMVVGSYHNSGNGTDLGFCAYTDNASGIWIYTNAPINNSNDPITGLIADKTTANTFYASVGSSIRKTTDNGTTWTTFYSNNDDVVEFTGLANSNGTYVGFVATYDDGVFWYNKTMSRWINMTTGGKYAGVGLSGNIFVCLEEENEGRFWRIDSETSEMGFEYNSGSLSSLATIKQVVGVNNIVFAFDDEGNIAWLPPTSTKYWKFANVANSRITSITYDNNTALYYASTNEGIYVSSDLSSWQIVSTSFSSRINVLFAPTLASFTGLFALKTEGEFMYELRTVFSYSQTLTPNQWVKEFSFSTLSSNFINATISEQNAYTDSVVVKVYSYNNQSLTSGFAHFTYNSPTASGTQNFSNSLGKLLSVNVINTNPSATTNVDIISDNMYSISATTSVQNANQTLIRISLTVQIDYTNVYSMTDYPLINLLETNTFGIKTVKVMNNVDTYGLPYQYYLVLYNMATQNTIAQIQLPITYQSNIQNWLILLNGTNFYLGITFNNGNPATSTNTNLTFTQGNITQIVVNGNQELDWVFLTKSNIDFSNTFNPVWDNNTLFFANFLNDGLQAGTLSESGDFTNILYRIDKNNNLQYIANIPTAINKFKDYGIKSGQEFSYELFYLNTDSRYSSPIKSNTICKQFRAYSLIEASQDTDNPNLYHAVKIWRFGNNLSIGAISNNNTPNWLTNFTPYRLKQPSSRCSKSGTLQALLSNYNQSENFYADTAQMMDDLYQASLSLNTFFLKDIKGNLYMVAISAPITQTIELKSQVQQVKISLPWEEVGDASNIAIVQLPTDAGYPQDQVFNVLFDVDLTTGELIVTYPQPYLGTTFELNNSSLIANTPNEIVGADLEIIDGAVIASKNIGG